MGHAAVAQALAAPAGPIPVLAVGPSHGHGGRHQARPRWAASLAARWHTITYQSDSQLNQCKNNLQFHTVNPGAHF